MTVCLFAGTPSPYLHRAVGQRSTAKRVMDYVSALPDVADVRVFSTDEIAGFPSDWSQVIEPSWDLQQLIDRLADAVGSADDLLLFAFVDQPYLSLDLTERLLKRHEKFRADYTFADGYPKGLGPELLRGRALSYMRELANGSTMPVDRDAIFSVVQKDMNRFDIETELSRTDQRLLRLILAVDTLANYTLCAALSAREPGQIDEWPGHVEENRELHRTLPAYVSVQVLEQDVQELSYSPYPTVHSRVLAPGAIMGLAKFELLLDELAGFSPESVVSISHWGEVALHPDVEGLIDAVVSRHPLRLLVETSGVGWEKASRNRLLSRKDVTVIVGLDTNDPRAYREIRGEGFTEAVEFAEAALESNPERTYIQAVRSDLTEPTLDEFYRHWSGKTSNLIIQKYDWFCGRLPQRKLGDLSPIVRFPCWHLQRDMIVLVDGSVPLCREDLDRSRPLGNVFEQGVAAVWQAGAQPYAEHLAGTYAGICEKCDEYYTFNF